MEVITITPWGLSVPGSAALVCDDHEFGQRLWLMHLDLDEHLFTIGPDWMNLAWLDKTEWKLGYQRVKSIGKGNGFLIVLDFFDSHSKTVWKGKITGEFADQVCQILTPGNKKHIGDVWVVDPGGGIFGEGWSLQVTKTNKLTFSPIIRGRH